MSEKLPDEGVPNEGPKSFGPHLRLDALLKKEFNYETKNFVEWNEVDKWRMERGYLIHELTSLGISQEDSFGHDIVVADHHDRQELTEILLDLAARNRFCGSSAMELLYDKRRVESECGLKVGKYYWTLRKPFIEYWQGRYKPDRGRLLVLKEVIQEERLKKAELPFEERAWRWIEEYFNGGCLQEVECPDGQDPDAVLGILYADFAFVRQLLLTEDDKNEIIQHLRMDFIGGQYPIVADAEVDDESQEAAFRLIEELASAPSDKAEGGPDHRAIRIVMALQRYRCCVAQGLDFEEEEQKRYQEALRQQAMYERDLERRQRDYGIESEFLAGLELPDFEAKDWPAHLLNIAGRDSFKPNPAYREQVHGYVRWLIERMPWAEEAVGDPWALPMHILFSYWGGRYHPDPLRWKVLQDECGKLAAGVSIPPGGNPISTFSLHQKFIEGSQKEAAKFNAAQDEEAITIAYQADLALIKDLGLSDDIFERAEWAYKKWLLEGKLPLAPNREMPDDRMKLETGLRVYVAEGESQGYEPDSSMILQLFCDHWHSISHRPAPRKE